MSSAAAQPDHPDSHTSKSAHHSLPSCRATCPPPSPPSPTAIQEATGIYRELVDRWPDARSDLEQALRVAAWPEHGEDLSGASQRCLRNDNGPLSLPRPVSSVPLSLRLAQVIPSEQPDVLRSQSGVPWRLSRCVLGSHARRWAMPLSSYQPQSQDKDGIEAVAKTVIVGASSRVMSIAPSTSLRRLAIRRTLT
jgi:hypothetical protein